MEDLRTAAKALLDYLDEPLYVPNDDGTQDRGIVAVSRHSPLVRGLRAALAATDAPADIPEAALDPALADAIRPDIGAPWLPVTPAQPAEHGSADLRVAVVNLTETAESLCAYLVRWGKRESARYLSEQVEKARAALGEQVKP